MADQHQAMSRLVHPNDVAAQTSAVTKPKETAAAMIKDAFSEHKLTLVEGSVATLLINFVALGISLFSMQVYDRVIPSQGYQTLFVLSIGVFLAICFEMCLKFARSHLMEHTVVRLDGAMSRNIFARLLSVRLDQMPQSVGTLAGQLKAYEGIRALLTASAAYVLIDIPFAFVFIVVIALLGSPYVAAVPLIFLLVSLLTGLALRRGIDAAALQGARAANMKTGLLVEAVEGAETLKSGHGGWRFLKRWAIANRQAIDHDLKIRRLSENGGFVTAGLQQLSYASLIAVGAWQVIEGNITMGGLIACSILSGRVLSPAAMLPGLMVQFAHAKAALVGLERIYALEVDNAQVEKPLTPARIYGHYQLEDLSYSYPIAATFLARSQTVLSIPKLEIQAGQKVAVLGAVGSGKSTLLRMLSGLYLPRQGRVYVDDLDISHIDQRKLTEQVGYLQQEHRLFQGTLRDNVLIGLSDPGDDEVIAAARETGLINVIRQHPLGLELPISEGGKGLSGGQRQLVALTRLALTQPSVWLLDEPTANLDSDTETLCIQMIKNRISSAQTLVLVTHKPSLIQLVDRILVIADHKLILDGPKEQVLQKLVGRNQL